MLGNTQDAGIRIKKPVQVQEEEWYERYIVLTPNPGPPPNPSPNLAPASSFSSVELARDSGIRRRKRVQEEDKVWSEFKPSSLFPVSLSLPPVPRTDPPPCHIKGAERPAG